MHHHPVVIVKHPDSPGQRYTDALVAFPARQICEGAVDVLQQLEAEPAHVVITEMNLVDMTGIELAEAIRDIDSEPGHFTYIILHGSEISDDMQVACENDIDVFVSEADPRILELSVQAGMRIADHVNQCTAACYQRIFDGVGLKSYKTSVGFKAVNIAMSICATHAEAGAPDPERMITVARSNLETARSNQSILVEHLAEQLDG